MKLIEIVDNSKTDKNTVHSYLPLYQELFGSKKEDVLNILEIGIQFGGSIQLWSEYFTNSTIYGLDICDKRNIMDKLHNKPNIVLYTNINAYDEEFFNNTFLKINKKFDVLIDDGPHTLESMFQFIKLYSQILTTDGILIIEDVQTWEWIELLKNKVPDHLQQYIKVYDLRQIKNRWDDLIFTIDLKTPAHL